MRAIDIHVHPPTRGRDNDACHYFKRDLASLPKTDEEFAALFMKQETRALLIGWHPSTVCEGVRNSNDYVVQLAAAHHLLLSDFDFRTKFIHDVTMTRGSAGNVVRSGRGEDLTFDHHKYANHANLFTDLDVGVGTNIFLSGGGAKLGRHCGAWSTWWNIRTERPVRFPAGWATDMINIVGVRSPGPAVTKPEGRWFEPIPRDRLEP